MAMPSTRTSRPCNRFTRPPHLSIKRSGLALALSLLISIGASRPAFAIGEVFRIEAVGSEYCGNFINNKFNASNNIDLWVFVASAAELVISTTPTFTPGSLFSMVGHTYLTGATKAAFVGGTVFQSLAFATIQGTVKFDKFGAVKSLAGVFTQDSVFRAGCFSSGKFKTVQRLL